MNAFVTKLRAVLPGVKDWMDHTLRTHANAASPVSQSSFIRLTNEQTRCGKMLSGLFRPNNSLTEVGISLSNLANRGVVTF
jgi:hypothetical protein